MSYPTIILGAGASHDFICHKNTTLDDDVRPPLTKDLCNPRYYLIKNIIDYFSINFSKNFANAFHNIITEINTNISNQDLESQLTIIKEKSDKLSETAKLERKKQLFTFELYLQKLFQEITKELKPHENNNYRYLLTYINDYSEETCCINFNYDLILENSFFNKDISNINTYIAGHSKLKIIKIHGSCNWMYKFELDNFSKEGPTSLDEKISYILNNPIILESYKKLDHEIVIQNQWFKDNKLYLPNIAIPLQGKASYICPKPHIDYLKKFLQETDRILIIGWAANDNYLIKTLEENLKENPLTEIPITIVSQTKSGTENVKGKLQHIKKLKFGLNFEGFSQFVTREQCEKFFAEKI